eukprot:11774253-Karenia_brevis.AAC.1
MAAALKGIGWGEDVARIGQVALARSAKVQYQKCKRNVIIESQSKVKQDISSRRWDYVFEETLRIRKDPMLALFSQALQMACMRFS